MPTEAQISEATRRQRLVQNLDALNARGYSLNRAASELGEPPANLSRYRNAWLAGGFEALMPRQTDSGRAAKFALAETEVSALRLKVLEKGSLSLGIEYFAESPLCQPTTKALILAELDRAARTRRRPNWPPSLRKAGRPTDDEAALFRGPKHFGDIEFCVRRGAFWVDAEGSRRPLEAGSIYESDDMSLNEPFSYVHPETGRIEIGRQSLCTMDVLPSAWLGGSPVARSRDAYRVEDIADHLLAVVQTHGLPEVWRLELGSWASLVIDGLRLEDGTMWGGLGALFQIQHVFKSRGKGLIESSFRWLQDHMAHESTEIGRFRGEFEAATRQLTRLAGLKDEAERARIARDFWDIADAADGLARAMQRMNARPRQRRMLGRDLQAPDDLRRGAVFRECPADQLWRFCPVKRPATVRGGHVECLVDHYPLPFRFQCNGVEGGQIYFEHGYKVLIAFHPGRPEEGCHIFNAEAGSRNRENLRIGELMLIAPLSVDAPQLNLAPGNQEFIARKNANAAVRTEFRAIRGVGQKTTRTSAVQDGWGNRAAKIHLPGGRGAQGEPATGLKVPHESAVPASPRPDPAPDLQDLNRRERELLDSLGLYA